MSVRRRRVQAELPAAVHNAQSTWRARAAIELRVEVDGHVGWGEAAPLPGYSDDTLQQVEVALSAWDGAPVRWPQLSSPAASFAAQAALVDVLAQGEGRPAAEWLAAEAGRAPRPSAPLCALITELDAEAVGRAAAARVAEGYLHLKLKVGRKDAFEAERRAVVAARGQLPAQGTLRVDANQAFAAHVLSDRLAALGDLGVDLVEEPAAPKVLDRLDHVPVPVALDESLRRPDASARVAAWAARGRLGALVLKPAVLGGVRPTLDWAARARALGVPVSLSHLFDGPVAHRAYAALALALGGGPHGLSPHLGLRAFAGRPPWPTEGGALRALDVPGLGLGGAE